LPRTPAAFGILHPEAELDPAQIGHKLALAVSELTHEVVALRIVRARHPIEL